jgi:nucleotide-binding universal stress UspA family protein
VEIEIQEGPPAERILDFAEERGCDLILNGSRGETGALRWRFGSVAFKVVRRKTTMPVLVVSS